MSTIKAKEETFIEQYLKCFAFMHQIIAQVLVVFKLKITSSNIRKT